MRTKFQLNVDKYVARPLAWVLNYLVRLVGQILRLDHSLDKDFKRIAVCKFKGMGSILQATPMLIALRNKFPNAEIIFVSTQSNKAILDRIDLIDHVVTVDDSGLWNLVRSNVRALSTLIRNRPDVYFDLEIYSHYSVIFTALTLSQNRIGFYLRSSSFRLGIYTQMMFYNPVVPISQVYLQLAQLLGCSDLTQNLYRLSGTLSTVYADKKYLVINPNASDLRLERRWGKDNFCALIRILSVKMPQHEICVIGSPAERTYVEELMAKLDDVPRVTNLAGRTDIPQLIGIIDHADFMISNDTGPMHIAFSTNTPVVCLFGPCSPNQYGNFKNAHIIYKRVYCSPCVHEFEEPPCKGNNVCMQLIQISDVLNGLEQLLSNKGNKQDTKDKIFFRHDDTVLGKVRR